MHGTAMHGETKEKRRKLGNGWKRQMPCFGHLLKWTLPFPKYLITFIDDGLLVTSRTIKQFFFTWVLIVGFADAAFGHHVYAHWSVLICLPVHLSTCYDAMPNNCTINTGQVNIYQ